MKETKTISQNKTSPIFRIGYAVFLLLVCYNLYMGQFDNAVSNFGIALIFDPFNHAVTWADRPLYQKVWLLTHCILFLTGFAFLIFN